MRLTLAAVAALIMLTPALAEPTPTFVNPVDYGAKFDGETDDAPAWNRAVVAAVAGKLSLKAPCGTSLLSAPVRVPAALKIEGSGLGCTILAPVSVGQAAILVTGSAAVQVRDLGIQCLLDGSQVGIRIAPKVNNLASEISSVRTRGCYIGVDFANAMTWSLHDSTIAAQGLIGAIGVHVANATNADAGDSTIHDNVISSGKPAAARSVAVLQNSSGGLKLYNNKILGWAYGYRLDLSPGAKTGDLLAYNNSLETITVAGFAFNHLGAGSFRNVVLTGNQFASCGAAVKNLAGRGYLSSVGITGNRLKACKVGVSMPGVSNLKQTGNY